MNSDGRHWRSMTAMGSFLGRVHEVHLYAQPYVNSFVYLSAAQNLITVNHFNQLHAYRNVTKQKPEQREQLNNVTFPNAQVFTCLHQSPTTNSSWSTHMRSSLFASFHYYLHLLLNLLHSAHRPPAEQPCVILTRQSILHQEEEWFLVLYIISFIIYSDLHLTNKTKLRIPSWKIPLW